MYVTNQNFGEEVKTEPVEVTVEMPDVTEVETVDEDTSPDPDRVAYSVQLRDEINKERAKTGLTPLLLPGQKPPAAKKDNLMVGAIALLVIILLLKSSF